MFYYIIIIIIILLFSQQNETDVIISTDELYLYYSPAAIIIIIMIIMPHAKKILYRLFSFLFMQYSTYLLLYTHLEFPISLESAIRVVVVNEPYISAELLHCAFIQYTRKCILLGKFRCVS